MTSRASKPHSGQGRSSTHVQSLLSETIAIGPQTRSTADALRRYDLRRTVIARIALNGSCDSSHDPFTTRDGPGCFLRVRNAADHRHPLKISTTIVVDVAVIFLLRLSIGEIANRAIAVTL